MTKKGKVTVEVNSSIIGESLVKFNHAGPNGDLSRVRFEPSLGTHHSNISMDKIVFFDSTKEEVLFQFSARDNAQNKNGLIENLTFEGLKDGKLTKKKEETLTPGNEVYILPIMVEGTNYVSFSLYVDINAISNFNDDFKTRYEIKEAKYCGTSKKAIDIKTFKSISFTEKDGNITVIETSIAHDILSSGYTDIDFAVLFVKKHTAEITKKLHEYANSKNKSRREFQEIIREYQDFVLPTEKYNVIKGIPMYSNKEIIEAYPLLTNEEQLFISKTIEISI